MGNLCLLTDVKTRLAITGSGDDGILNGFIAAASGLFDQYCQRSFSRSAQCVETFSAGAREVLLQTYPVEQVVSIQMRDNARSPWIRQDVEFELLRTCVLRLGSILGSEGQLARVLYVGGYVLPGGTVSTGQTALPDSIEQACIDQVATWYERRHTLRFTPVDGSQAPTRKNESLELLPHVRQILANYVRFSI